MPKIIKATDEQKREYRNAIMAKGAVRVPPLYAYVTIGGQECAIVYLGEGKDAPNYELIAPDGYCLEPERHSELYSTLNEMREGLGSIRLEPCEPDCGCGEGGKG